MCSRKADIMWCLNQNKYKDIIKEFMRVFNTNREKGFTNKEKERVKKNEKCSFSIVFLSLFAH